MGVEISVVIPVYRAVESLRPLYERLCASLEPVTPDFEIVLVEDRGGDGSWKVLCELADADPRVRAFQLSRNFGQEAATSAGLSRARGAWIVVMDCDLQDPPEALPSMYEAALQGFDVVRARRHKVGVRWRRWANRSYHWALRKVTGVNVDGVHFGAFSLISAKVRDAYLDIHDRDRNYLMILAWLGFDSTVVDVPHVEREHGKSSYSLRTLTRFALNSFFFHTTAPLEWIVLLGFTQVFIGFVGAIYLIVNRLVWGSVYPGWTSVMVLLTCGGGMLMVTLGITALYVGRTFTQTKGRPIFIIDREHHHEGSGG